MDNGSFETFDGDIADWIHQYRGRTKLSQALFAENADLTEEGIRNIERRRSSPRSVTLYKIAQACKIAPEHQPAFVTRFTSKPQPKMKLDQAIITLVVEPTNIPTTQLSLLKIEPNQTLTEVGLEASNNSIIQTSTSRRQLIVWSLMVLIVGLIFIAIRLFSTESSTIVIGASTISNTLTTTATLATPTIGFEATMAQHTAATRIRGDAARWPLVLSDTFDDNRNNWAISSTFFLDDYGDNRGRIENGQFLFDVVSKTPSGATIWNFPDTQRFFDDFYLSVDVSCLICNAEVSPGISFRTSDILDAESFYFLRFNYGQEIFLAKQLSQAPVRRIVRTIVPNINQRKHEVNHLEIIVRNNHFVVFINSVYAFDVYDDEFRDGNLHFFAYIPDVSNATIAYDNLEIRVPPK